MLQNLRISLAVLLITAVSNAFGASPSVQFYPREGKPYSTAVRVGDVVYVSGATGAAADGSYPTDFALQAANAMDAIGRELKLAGAGYDDVYKCVIALTNMDDWANFNTVYLKYFKPDHFPVRMSFGVTSLGGAAVEVQCEAYVKKR